MRAVFVAGHGWKVDDASAMRELYSAAFRGLEEVWDSPDPKPRQSSVGFSRTDPSTLAYEFVTEVRSARRIVTCEPIGHRVNRLSSLTWLLTDRISRLPR